MPARGGTTDSLFDGWLRLAANPITTATKTATGISRDTYLPAGVTINAAFAKAAEHHDEGKDRDVDARGEPANRRPHRVAQHIAHRSNGEEANVVMGAGLDAIHAKGAVHVSGLLRHIELQLAATLLAIAGNAVMGGATLAGPPGCAPEG